MERGFAIWVSNMGDGNFHSGLYRLGNRCHTAFMMFFFFLVTQVVCHLCKAQPHEEPLRVRAAARMSLFFFFFCKPPCKSCKKCWHRFPKSDGMSVNQPPAPLPNTQCEPHILEKGYCDACCPCIFSGSG